MESKYLYILLHISSSSVEFPRSGRSSSNPAWISLSSDQRARRRNRRAIQYGAIYVLLAGVIEGACRYLVKDRMEKTGARWSLEGAKAVLQLRRLNGQL